MGLAIAGIAAVGWLSCPSAPDDGIAADARHLENRLWVDRMPDDDRDIIGKLAFVQSVQHGPFGVVEQGSVWRHVTEVFQWKRHGGEVHLVFPQDGVEGVLAVRTWDCEGDAPEPFELCLALGPDEEFVLYSRRDWVLRPHEDGHDLIEDGPVSFELPLPPKRRATELDRDDDAVLERLAAALDD